MKLAIFGASGATGQHLVAQALAGGHEVTVLLRSPGSLSVSHARLRTIVGALGDSAAVEAVIQGVDAVISVLGARRGETQTLCSQGIRHILAAMQVTGVRRVIALSAYGASETRNASWFIRFVRLVIGEKMRDKDAMEAAVRESLTDWTLVRPPMLTNGKAEGDYRCGIALKPGIRGKISRADLAAFILQTAVTGDYLQQSPVVFGA